MKTIKKTRQQIAQMGGIARSKKLTKNQRSFIAMKGASARWNKK